MEYFYETNPAHAHTIVTPVGMPGSSTMTRKHIWEIPGNNKLFWNPQCNKSEENWRNRNLFGLYIYIYTYIFGV